MKLNLPRMRPTYIANIYRPPDGNQDNALSLIENKLIDIYAERPGDIVIMGQSGQKIQAFSEDLQSNTANHCPYKSGEPKS